MLAMSTASKSEVDSDTSCKEIIRTLKLSNNDQLLDIERRLAENEAALKQMNDLNKKKAILKKCMSPF